MVQSPRTQTPDLAKEGGFRRSVQVTAGGVNLSVLGGLEGEVTGQTTGEPGHHKIGATADLRPVYGAAGGLNERWLKQELTFTLLSNKYGLQICSFIPYYYS